ncbi:DUF4183 domain-containing protein [Metabacillus herbersteinensis]|uniref:DUF4183 domain-containing protein n=1 Tax=Metabacillus herbersteinensis TaxID=283816 RepID=A0ABV6GDW9_9BACI
MKNIENNVVELGAPVITIPSLPPRIIRNHSPKKVKVFEFYAISDGYSRIFNEEDGVKELGKQVILDPCKVSYMNLFLNGVLQPKESYVVESGVIKLKTIDVPTKGAPLILQMIKV